MNQIANVGAMPEHMQSMLPMILGMTQMMQMMSQGQGQQPAGAPATMAPIPNSAAAPERPHAAWDGHPEAKMVKDLFGLDDAPDQMTITTYQPVADRRIPYKKSKPEYVFRKELFCALASFMSKNDGDTLLLSGPHGSGKTSLPVEFCARVGRPVITVTGRKGMEVPDLLGQWVMTDKGFVWVDGALTLAARYGYVLIINEAFLCNPGELTGLNDIAEGNPLCLVQKGGEVVHPHPQFRLILTDNSGGQGDHTGLYAGVVAQNPSLLDRCCKMTVGYPAPEIETAIIARKLESMGENLDVEIIKTFVEVANAVRDVYTKEGGSVELTVTMSTRTLARWAFRSLEFKLPGPDGKLRTNFAGALDFALTANVEAAERKAIHEIARAKFGKYWTAID